MKDAKNATKKRPRKRVNKKRDFEERKERSEIADSTNDPAWYSASPELLRDAASIPFSWPTGTTMGNTHYLTPDVVPGIVVEELIPSVGNSRDANSPVNVAANAIYSFVRHANSGHSNYDAPDLMIYLLAMSNIYSGVTWCQRLLGMVSLFDQRNRYFPEAAFKALGVDYHSIRDNIANFRFWLNNYITKVASLAVPNTMNIFNRLAFLYSNIYIDGPTIKDQLYMLNPALLQWYKFELNSVTGAGRLRLEPMNHDIDNPATWEDIKTYFDALFTAVWEQEDFGIMSGDILKAYQSNIIKLSTVPVEFQIAPIYDPVVLHQFKNAKMLSHYLPTTIEQDENGNIIHYCIPDPNATPWQIGVQKYMSVLNKILTSDYEQPGPEVVIESSRLMYGYDFDSDQVFCGTEVLHSVIAVWFDNSQTLQYRRIVSTTAFADAWDSDAKTAVVISVSWLSKAFKYMPEIFLGHADSSGNVDSASTLRIWDIDNYAVLSNSDLEKMHQAALMSLFAVPAISKIS